MKPIAIISAAALLLAVQTSNAQFLNRLKKKAQAAVTNAVVGGGSADATNNTSTDNSNNTGDSDPAAQATPPSAFLEKYGKALFSLQPKERLVYGELSLSLKTDGAHIKTVTAIGRDYYLHDNNTRTGPFSKPPVDKLDAYKRDIGQNYNKEDYITNEGTSYISKGIFVVNGKPYGPALAAGSIYHNPKTKKFYAIVVRMEQGKMSYNLVTDKGTRKLKAAAAKLIVSDNGEFGGVEIFATQFNAKTDEEAFNYVTNDDTYIMLSNGKNLGPFKHTDGNSYLDNNGNYIQISSVGNKAVFVNGKQVLTINPDMQGYGAVFVNNKGTSAATFENGNLIFSDGTFIKNNALQPIVSTENGVEVLNWVSIQDNDVYICKKEL